MGYLSSLAWALGEMVCLFKDLDCIEVYINDITIFNNDLETHLLNLAKVLSI